jgi:drug/metabolite transporter (DMT)-like permease
VLSKSFLNWVIFVSLSIIWGSSFILMKLGLNHLSAFQIASLRICFSGLVLLPTAIKYFKSIPNNKLLIVFMSGMLGSFFPAYLFCMSEVKGGIDSALAGTLNSLTPIFAIVTGVFLFKNKISNNKIFGVVVSFIGSVLLLLAKADFKEGQNLLYIGYVIAATFCYGLNVNMVQKHLGNIPSLHIAAVALSLISIPAFIILYFTGYFNISFTSQIIQSTGAAAVLGILGTAVATILFYVLVKRAGAIFASTVTYGIPFVAILWGLYYNEDAGWKQVICLVIILCGVFIANYNKLTKQQTVLK